MHKIQKRYYIFNSQR